MTTRKPPFKRYIVFEMPTFYPNGGLGDVRDSFDTLVEATTFALAGNLENPEIVDRDTWVSVWVDGKHLTPVPELPRSNGLMPRRNALGKVIATLDDEDVDRIARRVTEMFDVVPREDLDRANIEIGRLQRMLVDAYPNEKWIVEVAPLPRPD